MKVSIITVCRNSAGTIEDTIHSVFSQDYNDIEYMIIDGESTDGTKEIIEKYRRKLALYISGKDHGMYDALNKGIGFAKGEVIGILNSDDFYADDRVISKVVEKFNHTNCDCLYADLEYVDRKEKNKIVRKWRSGEYREGLFLKGWMPPHPTFFVRREVYKKYGSFNTKFRIAADYELMLRFIHKFKIAVAYLPLVTVKMRRGGIGNDSLLSRLKANSEDRLAWKENNIRPGLFTLWLKPISKITQFIR